MIRVENFEVYGFQTAIRAMRNPHDSWDKSDSGYIASGEHYENVDYVVGEKDLELMRKLVKAGAEHRTFMRMIVVSMDITAPLYWWKEMDRYCVGKAQVSTSTMHCIHKKEFTLDDFSHEHLSNCCLGISEGYAFIPEFVFKDLIDTLNACRKKYLETKNKDYWYQMIQLLPTSYNQKRTVSLNYEVALNIIRQRSGHKLTEWNEFVEVLKELPYIDALLSA